MFRTNIATKAMYTSVATVRPMARKSAARSAVFMSVAATGAQAVGTLGLLAGGVGADGRTLDDGPGVDHELAARRHLHREAVHAPGGRTALLLPHLVVLRTVAGALEPLGGDALRHPAAQVGAGLVQ